MIKVNIEAQNKLSHSCIPDVSSIEEISLLNTSYKNKILKILDDSSNLN
jgi:hypothetical protein